MSLSQNHLEFIKSTGFIPVVGFELEFYIEGNNPNVVRDLIREQALSASIPIFDIKQEIGYQQYEAIFGYGLNIPDLANQVEEFKELAIIAATSHQHKLIFDAKPYLDQPGSGLHVHVNLLDRNGNNLFRREADEESQLMRYAIAGLLNKLPESMKVFAPKDSCYLRYNKEVFIKNGRKDIETPRTISWGGNNRTVALRIPESSLHEDTRRIEHRVPSSNSNANLVVKSIIAAVEYGINQRLKLNYPKIYGNAYEAQYNAPLLPQSLEEASG